MIIINAPKGFINLALDKNKDLANERKKHCDICYKSDYGNSKRCLKRRGGCGCILAAKRRVIEEKCPDNKW